MVGGWEGRGSSPRVGGVQEVEQASRVGPTSPPTKLYREFIVIRFFVKISIRMGISLIT